MQDDGCPHLVATLLITFASDRSRPIEKKEECERQTPWPELSESLGNPHFLLRLGRDTSASEREAKPAAATALLPVARM